MNRARIRRAATWLAGIWVLVALVGSACQIADLVGPGASATAAATAATTANSSAGGFGGAIRQVAQRVTPAVVQITNQQTQPSRLNGPITVPAGVGSGVIYDDQGHILTNDHVVAGAERLLASLPDGRAFPATLVGRDPRTDIAVLQIRGSDLPVAELGDPQQLQVGDWVVAIGNALALPGGPTVTAGIVGALNRTVREPGDTPRAQGPFLFDVIQTDAPINPGNSGGPLVNLQGQVIGINTLAAGQAEPGVQAQGIGFAIATSAAKPIADQLVATGQAVHPFVGIQYVPLNPAIVAQLGLNVKDGALIADVAPGSPAARTGLRVGDVVTEVDGAPVRGESDLARAVDAERPGSPLTLTVIRGAVRTAVVVNGMMTTSER